jgi:hypothetical protein
MSLLQVAPEMGSSISAQGQCLPGSSITSVTPVVELAKMIVAFLVMISGMLAFEFLILWMAAGKLIERIPF